MSKVVFTQIAASSDTDSVFYALDTKGRIWRCEKDYPPGSLTAKLEWTLIASPEEPTYM
jgi:hypothetical protein